MLLVSLGTTFTTANIKSAEYTVTQINREVTMVALPVLLPNTKGKCHLAKLK